MRKLLFTTIAIIFFITCGTSQNNISKIQNKDFRTLYSLFPQMKSLYNYKISTDDLNAKDIPPKLAKEFFSLKESDFIYNDYEYNYDEDVRYDNWKETLPWASKSNASESYIYLIYGIDRELSIINMYQYHYIIMTFDYSGTRIDSMTIRRQETIEEDNLDCVFLTNQTFRLFDYKVNPKHTTKVIDAQGRTQYVTHKEIPWTICTITEYRITDAGKIEKTGWTETKLLKESVTYYRQYHEDSDDPMNEYR